MKYVVTLYGQNSLVMTSFILFVVLALFNVSHAAQPNTDVRVGVYENSPLVGLNDDGAPKGFFIDILKQIAIEESWNLKFYPDTFSNCLKNLRNNKIDLMVAIAKNEERGLLFDFTNEVVCTLWGNVYVHKDSQVKTIHDLNKKKIAVVRKGIFGKAFKKLCTDFNIQCDWIDTTSQNESIHLLKARKVDAATFNNAFKKVYFESDIKETTIIFSPMKILFATKKETNIELLNAIDVALKKWKNNSASIYYKSLKKWLGFIEVERKYIPKRLIQFLIGTITIIIFSMVWILLLLHQIKIRKKIEAELRDDQERFRSLSDASFEGILITSKGKIIDANSALGKMFGYSRQEAIGVNVIDFVSPNEWENVRDKILSRYEGSYKTFGKRRNGTTIPIEVQAKMFSYKGMDARVTAVRDLSEQIKAQEEIKKLQGLLPICSRCKKIRDDKGYWNILESYIEKHSDAQFSHGMCPDCLNEFYGDKEWYIRMKKNQNTEK